MLNKRSSLLAAAAAAVALAGGLVAAAPSAGAATAAASCSPKTDFQELDASSFRVWANYCGEGYEHPYDIYVVRTAAGPYTRIWFHKNGKTWCAWGSSDRNVPVAFQDPDNILISANKAAC